ncbi:DUF4082 domain-containing protein [Glutamicibacter sp. NPDC087344]|uniref:DUF4082 domain-containing protein n=1 Tax=Glutamicibacter sp. NPDC087344 TaxID=3363994 RepID=UPI003811AA23
MGTTRHFFKAIKRSASTAVAAFSALALVLVGLTAVSAPAVAADCGPGANAIVCENSKPGTSFEEWDIDGAGDDSIQGFATDISVNVGQRVEFKVDTDASDYSIDIYRTGWYQGLGARKITSIQPSASLPQNQPECLSDVTTELIDCGTWAVSASWDVSSDAVSGVYLAKLTRDDTGGSSHITFIVRNEASTSDILVQTSDPTWHAYNLYGGSDFYSGADNGRAFKLSYNRPFATRDGIEARDFYFGAEYPLVRFLERNGYDVSYFSGVDTDRHGELLTNHKVFVSVGHDEYWSGQQRKNVEDARDAGVNLQFLTGNEVYWRTRYEKSPTDQNDYRTLVSYKETWGNNKIDPADEWTGTWRDPRYASTEDGGGLPENALTGTAYVVNSGDLPVTVNAEEGKMRLWRDTPLDSQDSGTKTELAPHTVGYESNEDLPNGFRPPGLIHLSTTTGSVPEYLQDFGNTVAPNDTTHHTTMYRAASGALVFSTGSVQWTWGLDQWHDGNGAPADERMQQAQVNLFADMDTLPTTLMSELVLPTAAKDTTAPTLTVTEAPTGSVRNGEIITVKGTATDVGGRVAAVEYSFDGGTSWKAATGTSTWSFTAVQEGSGDEELLVRAVDDSANYPQQGTTVPMQITGPYSVFGQRVPKTADSGDGSEVELGLRFTAKTDGYVTGVRFYKSQANTGAHTGTLWTVNGTQLATVAFTNESAEGWQTATFTNPVEARAGDEFVVSYYAPNGHYSAVTQDFAYRGAEANPIGAAGGFGTPAAGLFVSGSGFPTRDWDKANYFVDAVFETGESITLNAYGHTPADTARSVPITTPIGATLSKKVDASSVQIVLKDASNNTVPGTTSYDSATRKATFTPQAELARGTVYSAEISATDTTGNPVDNGATWTFTTVLATPADPNECPCGLYPDAELPTVPVVNDGRPVTLGTRFSATEDGQLLGLEFYRSPGETGAHNGWLYSSAGEQLAQVTFPDDSAVGWQYAAFDSPVSISANTEYVAAYRSNGIYPVTPGALGAPTQVGPLRTSASAGHYSYAEQFPDSLVSSSYLVDVRFQPQGQPVGLTDRSPNSGVFDASVDSQISATFSQQLESGAKLEVATGGNPIPGTTEVSEDLKKLTFTPDTPLPEASTITVTPKNISGVDTGAVQIPAWTFRTSGGNQSLQTFLGTQEPANLDPSDSSAVELGLRFNSGQDIEIQGLRYYQGPLGAGEHTGSVWDAQGNLLGTAIFPATTTQGWQTAFLSTPVTITAGSDFAVSYQAPKGGYVFTGGDFSNGKTDGVLSLKGTNGIFSYGSGSMPSSSWNSSNYFADLVYRSVSGSGEPTATPTPSTPEPTSLQVTGRSPEAQASGVSTTAAVSATFNRAVAEGSSLSLTQGGSSVAGTSSLNTERTTATFTPEEPLQPDTIYTVGFSITGEPAGFTNPASYSFRTQAEPEDPASCPCGLFNSTEAPTVPVVADGTPVTLGTRFSSDVEGSVSGLKFYRSMSENGPHTGTLYSTAGDVLATVQFPDTGVSGWQYAEFETPIEIQANNDYVAAYRSNGTYPASPGKFATDTQNGHLKTSAGAGHYTYGTGYPSSTVTTSYLVDVRFTPKSPPVTVVERSPEAGASGIALDSTLSATFSQALENGAKLKVSGPEGEIDGVSQVDQQGMRVTFTPKDPLPESSVLTVAPQNIRGVDSGETAIDPWTVHTSGAQIQLESFLGDQVPLTLNPQDSGDVELGMRLEAAQDLTIHAIRYYRGSTGTGASTGNIWDAQGTRLATTTFGPSTEPGWYTAYLSNTLEFNAGEQFTVSYHTPNGGYVVTGADFANGKDNGVLSLSGSNGLYAYGPSTRPTGSWNSSNYHVDLLYSLTPAPAARQATAEVSTAEEAIESPEETTAPETTKAEEPEPEQTTEPEATTAAPSDTPTPEPTSTRQPQLSRPPESTEE